MVVRRTDGAPVPPQAPREGPGGGGLQDLLSRSGLLGGGKNPTLIATAMLKQLQANGFGAMGGADLAQALRQALSAFQRAANLPVTGKPDPETVHLLQKMGMLPGQGINRFQDGVEKKAENARGSTTEGGPRKTDKESEKETVGKDLGDRLGSFLGGLRSRLVGEGSSKGGGFDGQNASGQGNAMGAHTDAQAAHGAAAKAGTDEKVARESAAFSLHEPLDKKGVREGEKGGAAKSGKAKGTGRGGEGVGSSTDDDGDGAQSGGDDRGASGERGNATSGDDEEGRRGHAQTGDEAADAGAYRIGPLGAQLFGSLEKIAKDVASDGRSAATYSLDLVLHRPGVYGAGQAAEELVHIVVQKADAFDAAWEQLVAAYAKLIARYAPDDAHPSIEDVRTALRRARYRDDP